MTKNLDSIKPYPRNAKKHSVDQIKKIARSIQEFGFNQPIVVDKENVIIVGHGRYEAAKLLGLKEVPIIELDISPEKAKAYRLADNRLNQSEWDMQLVIEELKDLHIAGLDITITGFEKKDMNIFDPAGLVGQGVLDSPKTPMCLECGGELTCNKCENDDDQDDGEADSA